LEAYRVIRKGVPPIKGDRRFSEDIGKIARLIGSGEFLQAVEKAVGGLA